MADKFVDDLERLANSHWANDPMEQAKLRAMVLAHAQTIKVSRPVNPAPSIFPVIPGAQGPYTPMSAETQQATNIHNKWFKGQNFDPMWILGLRLRRPEGSGPLPFDFYTSYCNDAYVWISYVVQNEMITLRDDAHMFPSDELVATLKLAIEAHTR